MDKCELCGKEKLEHDRQAFIDLIRKEPTEFEEYLIKAFKYTYTCPCPVHPGVWHIEQARNKLWSKE